MHPPLNIERQEEKDSVKIKFKRHFVTELDVIKRIGDNFRAMVIDVITEPISLMTVIPATFKGLSDNHGRLHLQLALTCAVLPHHPFWIQSKWEINKMATPYCSFQDRVTLIWLSK